MLTTMHEVLRLSMLCTSYLFIFRHELVIFVEQQVTETAGHLAMYSNY